MWWHCTSPIADGDKYTHSVGRAQSVKSRRGSINTWVEVEACAASCHCIAHFSVSLLYIESSGKRLVSVHIAEANRSWRRRRRQRWHYVRRNERPSNAQSKTSVWCCCVYRNPNILMYSCVLCVRARALRSTTAMTTMETFVRKCCVWVFLVNFKHCNYFPCLSPRNLVDKHNAHNLMCKCRWFDDAHEIPHNHCGMCTRTAVAWHEKIRSTLPFSGHTRTSLGDICKFSRLFV